MSAAHALKFARFDFPARTAVASHSTKLTWASGALAAMVALGTTSPLARDGSSSISPTIERKRPQALSAKFLPAADLSSEDWDSADDGNSVLFDGLLSDLSRLEDGWASPDSVAPTPEVIRDIQTASVALNCSRLPDAEVDEDDGSVTLLWEDAGTALSLIFKGDGSVIGVLSPGSRSYPAWQLPAEEDARIAEKLDNPFVGRLLGSA